MVFSIKVLAIKRIMTYVVIGMAVSFIVMLFLGNTSGSGAWAMASFVEVVLVVWLMNAVKVHGTNEMEWMVSDEGISFNKLDVSQPGIIKWEETDRYSSTWQRYGERFDLHLKTGGKLRFYVSARQQPYREFLELLAPKYNQYCT